MKRLIEEIIIVSNMFSCMLNDFKPFSSDFETTRARIIFTGYFDGNPEIYIMNQDGTTQIRLTHNSSYDIYPSFSHE